MLTKIKRIRRKKYATGDEARKFENIPTGSQPQQGGLGTRNQNIFYSFSVSILRG